MLMAPNLHFSMQAPHLMHTELSIKWGCFFSPEMASTGHTRAQSVHPVQRLGLITYFFKARHCLDGQFPSFTCASYSSGKLSIVERTGLGEVCPSPHKAVSFITLDRLRNRIKSPSSPCPSVIRSRISWSRLFPIRQGVHFPQLSFLIKSIKKFEF